MAPWRGSLRAPLMVFLTPLWSLSTITMLFEFLIGVRLWKLNTKLLSAMKLGHLFHPVQV